MHQHRFSVVGQGRAPTSMLYGRAVFFAFEREFCVRHILLYYVYVHTNQYVPLVHRHRFSVAVVVGRRARAYAAPLTHYENGTLVHDGAVFSCFEREYRERHTMFMYIYKPRPVPALGQQPLLGTGTYKHKAIWMCTAVYRTSCVLGSSRDCCWTRAVFTVVLITRFRGCYTRYPMKEA